MLAPMCVSSADGRMFLHDYISRDFISIGLFNLYHERFCQGMGLFTSIGISAKYMWSIS